MNALWVEFNASKEDGAIHIDFYCHKIRLLVTGYGRNYWSRLILGPCYPRPMRVLAPV